MSKYKLAVVIGRFQPLHYGHIKLIEKALECSDKVLVLIGSSFAGQSHKNPFDYVQRSAWVKNSFLGNTDIDTVGISDFPHSDEEWVAHTTTAIVEYGNSIATEDICIVGHNKDESSYYLENFPFPFIDIDMHSHFHSTDLRDFIYTGKLEYAENAVPFHVYKDLIDYAESEKCAMLAAEKEYQIEYMRPYNLLDFPPIFVTGDAVVLCNNYILLIKRGNVHGYGQWALPGGYLDSSETMQDCILRELKEETGIDVKRDPKAHLIDLQLFDQPGRSVMARSITYAGLISMHDHDDLPEIAACDDALEARWFHLDSLVSLRTNIFLDHYHVMLKMIEIDEVWI